VDKLMINGIFLTTDKNIKNISAAIRHKYVIIKPGQMKLVRDYT